MGDLAQPVARLLPPPGVALNAGDGVLLTPTEIARLLATHGLAPRRRAGQNFLIDPNTVRRIVDAADLDPGDEVLEIGPGLGSLTLGLSATVRRVTAVEIDAGMVTALGEVLAGVDNVEVVHADALAVDLGQLVDQRPVRAVANLPYNVATPLLFGLLATPAVTDAYLMVQREVGERWQARVGDPRYAGVSIKLGLIAEVAIDLAIPRAVFHPVPNVDSVMVRIRRRDDAPSAADHRRLATLVDTAFAQRRKTLRNTLAKVTDPERLRAAAALAGIDLAARAETLDVADIVRLDAALGEVSAT